MFLGVFLVFGVGSFVSGFAVSGRVFFFVVGGFVFVRISVFGG